MSHTASRRLATVAQLRRDGSVGEHCNDKEYNTPRRVLLAESGSVGDYEDFESEYTPQPDAELLLRQELLNRYAALVTFDIDEATRDWFAVAPIAVLRAEVTQAHREHLRITAQIAEWEYELLYGKPVVTEYHTKDDTEDDEPIRRGGEYWDVIDMMMPETPLPGEYSVDDQGYWSCVSLSPRVSIYDASGEWNSYHITTRP